jgi:hypothetical protein
LGGLIVTGVGCIGGVLMGGDALLDLGGLILADGVVGGVGVGGVWRGGDALLYMEGLIVAVVVVA